MGEHEFNKRAKSKELKPVSEIVVVPVPPLIDRETFDAGAGATQGPTSHGDAIRRHQRPDDAYRPDPLRQCGGAMTIRTGKGGRYRYYACSMKARPADSLRRCQWTSWTILSPAISKTVSSSPKGWKRSSPQCSTGGRSDPSASMSTLAN
jgi:hypothetical protein